jgi:hypothetical protein
MEGASGEESNIPGCVCRIRVDNVRVGGDIDEQHGQTEQTTYWKKATLRNGKQKSRSIALYSPPKQGPIQWTHSYPPVKANTKRAIGRILEQPVQSELDKGVDGGGITYIDPAIIG